MPIPARALEVLQCPRCGAQVHDDHDGSQIVCTAGHRFGLERGYLDATVGPTDEATRRTFESFGYEWNTFDDVRPEDTEFAENYFEDLDLASLHGQIGLDAGCGKGRYSRFLAPHLQALIALDGSSAVEAAARNLADAPNVLVVKSDLRLAPVRPGSLDFISCLGVLHHLEDPRAGFLGLTRLLAPAGSMLLYLYSRPERRSLRWAGLAVAAAMRRTTVGMPHRLLRLLCIPIAAALYLAVVEPGRAGDRWGVGALARLPLATYRGAPLRSLVLDTFDRLSAPVEHRFVWADLEPWFSEAGLRVLAARERAGWFVLLRRHAPGS